MSDFEFERQYQFIRLWDENSKTTNHWDAALDFTFADINNDGLPDLIVTSNKAALFYIQPIEQ